MAIPDGYNTQPIVGIVGADDADNEVASTNVVPNADGSLLERLEDVKDTVNASDVLLGTIGDVAGTDTIIALLKAIKVKTDTIV